MAFIKFAHSSVLGAEIAQSGSALMRTAHRHSFDYSPREGFLYVRSRAISSRTNDNFDTFPAEEIKQAWATFIGKPVFVNHNNDDHRRARGVIIDAALHEDTAPDGTPDTWVEVLMEIDAVNFPKLAKSILAGDIERTSMGCDVQYSLCSVCGNKASTPVEYCQHIPRLKGKKIRRRTASGDGSEDVLVHEVCCGLSFFENSVLVEPPADPTAHFLGVDTRGVTGMAKAASRKESVVIRKLEYRGWEITLTDTGSRRIGRERWYIGSHPDFGALSSLTLSDLKSMIDIKMDLAINPAAAEMRQRVMDSLRSPEGSLGLMNKTAWTPAPKIEVVDGVQYAVRTGYDPDAEVEIGDGHCSVEATVNGKYAGALVWDYLSDPPTVLSITVEPEFQRKGIATMMWSIARKNESKLEHSQTLTEDGLAWSQSLGSRKASRAGLRTSAHKNVAQLRRFALDMNFGFDSQASQFADKGTPGISYEKGDVGGGDFVDCLLWRDNNGVLRGILYHYSFDTGFEPAGSVNLLVDDSYRKKGIATALLDEAVKRFKVNLKKQVYTRDGYAFITRYKGGKFAPKPPFKPGDPVVDFRGEGRGKVKRVWYEGERGWRGPGFYVVVEGYEHPTIAEAWELDKKPKPKKNAQRYEVAGRQLVAERKPHPSQIPHPTTHVLFGKHTKDGRIQVGLIHKQTGFTTSVTTHNSEESATKRYKSLQNRGYSDPLSLGKNSKKYKDNYKGNTTERGYGWDHQKKREELLKDNPKCHHCKKNKATEADHYRGGLVPSCFECNNKRSHEQKKRKKKESARQYPSVTGLQPGDRFTHERYGDCVVTDVRRARNNKGIQGYDVVRVIYGDNKIMNIPMFSRPQGVRKQGSAGTMEKARLLLQSVPEYLHSRVEALLPFIVNGPNYNRGVDEELMTAIRMGDRDDGYAREWFLRKAEAKAHYQTTGEWIKPIHPGDEQGPKDQMSLFTSRRLAFGETKAPSAIDTLRVKDCPVCGEDETFDSDGRCQVCGYLPPPEPFREPDLEVAQKADMRSGPVNEKLLKAPAFEAPDEESTGNDDEMNQEGESLPTKSARRRKVAALDWEESMQNMVLYNGLKQSVPVWTTEHISGEAAVAFSPTDSTYLFSATGRDGEELEGKSPSIDEAKRMCERFLSQHSEMAGQLSLFSSRSNPRPVKKQASPRKYQRHQSVEGDTMRPSTVAAARQQQIIKIQADRIRDLERSNRILRRRADVNNPAQPVPEPGQQAPAQTTEDARAAQYNVQVTTPGGIAPAAPAMVNTDVTTPGGVAAAPSAIKQDVTAPVSGYNQSVPDMRTEVEVVTDAETIGENYIKGDWANTTAKMQARTFASLRLARLRIEAGLVSGDDIAIAQKIASSRVSDAQIRTEIETLTNVRRVDASRRPSTTRHQAVRNVPSLVSTAAPVVAVAPPSMNPSSDEFLFD